MDNYHLTAFSSFSLHQDVAHGLDIAHLAVNVNVSTRVGQVSRVCPAGPQIQFSSHRFCNRLPVVAKDTNSGFIMDSIGTPSIETFHVTVGLQRSH